MAELVKTAEKGKYIRSALNTCIDPTDWETKCRLTEFLLKRLEPTLPPEILQLSVERMAQTGDTSSSLTWTRQVCFTAICKPQTPSRCQRETQKPPHPLLPMNSEGKAPRSSHSFTAPTPG
ncbi:hypothetical protein FJY63_00960 [Candidatus Sumerlaeota bacterium]|nr:hypothetical protein [Candidatus Sumerlaeota bacterium]